MEWDNGRSLALIDEYRKHPVLWDPRNNFHNSKNRKQIAWEVISQRMNLAVMEVKQKMNSLLGSFRREKAKGLKQLKTEHGVIEIYASKWFAFDRMRFLLFRHNATNVKPPLEDYSCFEHHLDLGVDVKEEEEERRGDYFAKNTESLHNYRDETYSQSPSPKKPKKESSTTEHEILDSFKVINRAFTIISSDDDDCSKFARYVAAKLRN